MLLIITLAVLAVIFCYSLIAQGGADCGRSRADLDDEQATAITSARKAVTMRYRRGETLCLKR